MSNGAVRQPLIVTVGHVDAGKTLLLDKVRGTAVAAREAGGITQSIGCSYVPLSTVQAICGDLLKALKISFTIPGLLFIDTPGHAAFTNLRRRGGNLADIAILVIDLVEGFKPQTYEAIEILKGFKTPFVVAANKLDLSPGWRPGSGLVSASISSQAPAAQEFVEQRIYDIVGKLSELGFGSERFDRVEDYSRQVAIIPCSAKSGEGIPELLMVISGLAQKFLEQSLRADVSGPAKGTVLEVKRDKGLGTTLDVIVYDGVLRKGDAIVIGGLDSPVVTRVKALFEPAPLAEMGGRGRFEPVDSVSAAAGVKVVAPDVDNVVAGAPLRGVLDNLEAVSSEVQSEVQEVLVETERAGVVVKADTLGSLEALLMILKEKSIPVRRASIGDVTRKDVKAAQANTDPLNSAVLAFNVAVPDPAQARVFASRVIYQLIEEFEAWQAELKKTAEAKVLDALVRPCRLKILAGYVFRQSNPAVFGVEILVGVLKAGMPVMSRGKAIGLVKSIQLEQESVNSADAGSRVAVSMDNVTVGRQVNEGDELISAVPEEDYRKLKQYSKYLSKGEVAVLRELADTMRKYNPVWGV